MNNEDCLISERAVLDIDDDRLDRNSFAKTLAQTIYSWHGADSLVIGLRGKWGCGKTSLKNFMLHHLKRETCPPEVVEFNPWQWASQDQISKAFFEEISGTLELVDDGKKWKDLAKAFRRYGRFLNAGEALTTGIEKALPTLFVITASCGGLGWFADFFQFPVIATISKALFGVSISYAAILKWGKNIVQKLAGDCEELAKEKELTLAKLRTNIIRSLKKEKKTLLIVLDDLDRLTTPQLRMVIQLVKANSEFPYVVFLLLFEREIVEQRLTEDKINGSDYLEKIIQIPFDVPVIKKEKVFLVFTERLKKSLGHYDLHEELNSVYWGNVFNSFVKHYFVDLRDVYRFISTFSFHLALFKGEEVFEVHPVDFVAVEVLRVFEPKFHEQLAHKKQLLTSQAIFQKDSAGTELTDLFSFVSEERRDVVWAGFEIIFPYTQGYTRNINCGDFRRGEWKKEKRVCSPSNFDSYFRLSLSEDDLSHSEFQRLVNSTKDYKSLMAELVSLNERKLLSEALDRLRDSLSLVSHENIENCIQVALNYADCVDTEGMGDFAVSSNSQLTFLVVDLLKQIKSSNERGEMLLRCFNNSQSGLTVIESIVYYEKKDCDNSLLEAHCVERLKELFLREVNEWLQDDPESFFSNNHALTFMYRWKSWGDPESLKSGIDSFLEKEGNVISLLNVFAQIVTSHTSGDYVSIRRRVIRQKKVAEFVSVDRIQMCLDKIDRSVLKEESAELIRAFENAEGDEYNFVSM